jgi:hypothetical protein
MTDRELALDIGQRWLESEAQVTALVALLEEHMPDWKKRLSAIPAHISEGSNRKQLAALQRAIDEDESGDSHLRILHRVLFE